MPSAEDTSCFPSSIKKMIPFGSINHHHHQDSLTSRDVDVLVSRLKENLRLSNLKSRSSISRSHNIRPTPYRLPSRSWMSTESSLASACVGSNDCCESCKSRYSNSGPGELDRCFTVATCQRHNHYRHHHHQQRQHYYHQQQQPYCRLCCCCRRKGNSYSACIDELDDSYERFEALLRKGSLIKEAVKRLQINPEEEEEEIEIETENEDRTPSSLLGAGSTATSASACKIITRGSNATTTYSESTTLDSMDDDEEDDSSNDDFLYRRKNFYYDSEDEPLPAIYHQQHAALDI